MKGVLHYLRTMAHRELMLGGRELELQGYCDSDYAADPGKRRSTGGYLFSLAGSAISWGGNLVLTVAISTLEAEYMASACGAGEALHVWRITLCESEWRAKRSRC
jgi:hypothetical protein